MHDHFLQFIRLLNGEGAEYVVIGRFDDFLGYERFVTIGDEPYKIEIITRTMGVTFEETYTNRIQVLNQGVQIDSDRLLNAVCTAQPVPTRQLMSPNLLAHYSDTLPE